MKFLIVSVCALACAYAAVGVEDKDAVIVRSDFDSTPEGGYSSYVETNNNIVQESTGTLRKIGEKSAVVVQGSSSFIAPDGQTYKMTFIADENGFQPQADYLPTPPAPEPIPDYILRSLEYIAANPYKGDQKK